MAIIDSSKKNNNNNQSGKPEKVLTGAEGLNQAADNLGIDGNAAAMEDDAPHTIMGTSGTSGLQGLALIQEMYGNVLPTGSTNSLVKAYLDQFHATYDEIRKSERKPVELEFLPLYMDRNDLPYSSIAVCYPCNYHGKRAVSVHVCILEDNGAPPMPQRETVENGEVVEVPTTAGDMYNNDYRSKVNQRVKQQFGDVTIIDAGYSVVYNTIDPEDINAVERVLTMTSNATVGATKLDNREDLVKAGRSVASVFKNNGLLLTARVDTMPPPLVSANGLRIRRDMSVTTSVSAANTQNNLRQAGGRGLNISEVSMFATLEYTVPETPQFQPGMNPQMMQQYTPTQRFIPRVVITDVSTQGFSTLPSVLLGISSATVIQEGVLWMENFRPRTNRRADEIDIRDIGAIGWEIPELNEDGERGKVPTTTKSFDSKAFYDLMAATVTPNVIYSIDIEEAGPLSWLMYAFTSAAQGDQHSRRSIIEACDSLTDGLFSKYFAATSGEILRPNNNRVLLGTYVDGTTNEVRDIRDIDYLAILNLCGEDPTIIEAWENTQRDSGGSLAKRIRDQHALLEEIIGSSMEVKGYAQRFTFHGEFVQCLARATRDAGIAPRFQNLPAYQQAQQRERMSNFEWAMVQQQAVQGVNAHFMGGNSNQPGFGMPNMPHQGVWSGYYSQ